MAFFYEFVTVHERFGPLNCPDSDTEERCGETETHHEVVETNRGHIARNDGEDDVGDGREHAADDGEEEETGNAAFHAFGFLLVEVSHAKVLGCQSGVLGCAGALNSGARVHHFIVARGLDS